MADKITLTNLSNLQNENTAVNALNTNNAVLVAALNNTLSRDGTAPNPMQAQLDMNSNQIINLPAPGSPTSPVRLQDIVSGVPTITAAVGTSGHTVPFLDGNNTWSGTNTFNNTVAFSVPPTIAFQQPSGTLRTVDSKLKDFYYSVKDFGAVGDGVTDDTVAITLTDTKAAAAGKGVWFPAGTYKVSSTITPSTNSQWIGESRFRSVIVTTSTTGDILNIPNGGVIIESLGFSSSVTRTGGSVVNITGGSPFYLRDFQMSNVFTGIMISNPVVDTYIQDGTITCISDSSIGMDLRAGLVCQFDRIICTTDGIHHPFAQCAIRNGGDYNFTNCQFLAGSQGMAIFPQTGQTVTNVRCTACWFDTCTNVALNVAPSGTAFVGACDFVQCGFTSATNVGISLNAAVGGPSLINLISFTSCIIANAGLVGVQIYGNVNSASFVNNMFQLNPTHMTLGGNCNMTRVVGNTFVDYTNGIIIDGSTMNGTNIQCNNFLTAVGAIGGTLVGTNNILANNTGYNPVGTAAPIALTISPQTITAGPTPETHYLRQVATNTASVFQGGQTILSLKDPNTFYTINLGPNESYQVTWATTAPTVTKVTH